MKQVIALFFLDIKISYLDINPIKNVDNVLNVYMNFNFSSESEYIKVHNVDSWKNVRS